MTDFHSDALAALEWYISHGADEALSDAPANRFLSPVAASTPAQTQEEARTPVFSPVPSQESLSVGPPRSSSPANPLGTSGMWAQAVELAAQAQTLEELREAVAAFDGLAIRKTATNLVFSDGNPEASVMLVGEAPGADEDRQGKPFVGISGQLLDRILAAIDLDRTRTEPERSVYISNILNWRPPGNRTPTDAEVLVSLPFIEKHIMLVRPKILILCGGVSAKALLGTTASISRLRRVWHDYRPATAGLGYEGPSFPAIATYHPAYLLRTPTQKKAVWADMLAVKDKMRSLGIL
ncbi:MAG: uracil-DNA glycosylase [Alphaproteobacteria bacterium]|nr:uracil-DNA glycosylase [Alphaproteobacteria bacterium]